MDLKVQIASPCRAKWSEMSGDERVRFCALCKKSVYNFAAMKRDEVLGLMAERDGKICVRVYQRADGTALTADCPVGRRMVRRMAAMAVVLVAAIVFLPAVVMASPTGTKVNWDDLVNRARRIPLIGYVVNKISPERELVMGAMSGTSY